MWACRVVSSCLPAGAAAPHWLFLPSWPRLLTQNTFAISFIPSSDGARRSFMRGLPKARTSNRRQDESATDPAGSSSLGPSLLHPPSLPFLPSSVALSCTQSPIWPLQQLTRGSVFLPCKSQSKTCQFTMASLKLSFTVYLLEKQFIQTLLRANLPGSLSPVRWYTCWQRRRRQMVAGTRLALSASLAARQRLRTRLPPDVTREEPTTWESPGSLMTQFL